MSNITIKKVRVGTDTLERGDLDWREIGNPTI